MTVKLATGLATGSLAFIAEAVHSGTDLVAALLTFFAVRVAVRPPDREHHYGHGKAEHLAALGESAFLLLVSLFIAGESVRRLIDGGGGHDVDVTWWALTVLGVVIVVDATRALASFRAAQRHSSAALAANALHFTADLAGSVAVLIGLLLVRAGEPSADAAAALFVAVLVVVAARAAGEAVDRRPDGPHRRRRRRPHPRRARAVRRRRRAAAGPLAPRRRPALRRPRGGRADGRGRDPGAHGGRQGGGRGGARARRRRRRRARGADRGRGRHPRARDGRRARHPGGTRGAQRARDARCPTATSCRCT